MVRLTQSAGCWCPRIPVFLLGAGLFTVLLGIAQEPVITPNRAVRGHVERRDAAPSLRMDVNRVFIPVTVTDAYGRKVEGLGKDDFRIFEDGAQQTISEFFVDDSPVSVGIALDASHSMTDKIDASRKAMVSFIKLSAPEDEFFLITVQDHPELVHTFTRDAEEIQHEMDGVRTQGWTALYDGMYLGVNHARHANRDNRALVVLSDGGDNNSRYTESEIKNL